MGFNVQAEGDAAGVLLDDLPLEEEYFNEI